MTKLKDKLWIWGQTEGSHHINDAFKLPGKNRMTPMAGAEYFGISNMCRVVMAGLPSLPFDKEAEQLDTLKNVIWSVIGDGSSKTEMYTEEIIRLSKKHQNISGIIMDDFFNERRMKIFTPSYLQELKEKIRLEAPRHLPLWAVVYVRELTVERKAHLAECEKMTMWTWHAEDLYNLAENYEKLRSLWAGEEIYAGCYMWDYGNQKEMPEDLMHLQLDTYYSWLKLGKIAGMILCSNCCTDVGLKTAEITKKWIKKHGDEEI